jgi:hypothetical protein
MEIASILDIHICFLEFLEKKDFVFTKSRRMGW